jgi:predicted ATPase
MTNAQLYVVIAAPVLANAVLFGLFLAYINAKFETVNQRFEGVNQRFESIDRRFEAIDRRFDDMRALWLAELHRVEEVLDARLKHLEER